MQVMEFAFGSQAVTAELWQWDRDGDLSRYDMAVSRHLICVTFCV